MDFNQTFTQVLTLIRWSVAFKDHSLPEPNVRHFSDVDSSLVALNCSNLVEIARLCASHMERIFSSFMLLDLFRHGTKM
jgi:hypothetical protein